MEHCLEVAALVRGEVIGIRRLSARRERLHVLRSAGLAAATVLVGMAAVVLVLTSLERIVYAPVFVGAWLSATAAAVLVAVRRARAWARHYVIGTAIQADAYAAVDMALVRRGAEGYELALVPGMTGELENGRSPLPVEALTARGPTRVEVPRGTWATVSIGSSTFALRWGPERGARDWLAVGALARLAGGAATSAALLSVLAAAPAARAMTDEDLRSSIPSKATPWETEKLLRAQAQAQSHTLHRCFDPLPLECQRSGFVGVGLRLSREGEIRSHWISSTTYGSECPVSECMEDVIADWYFEPLPEAMPIVLPVQVVRTRKPLPRFERAAALPAPTAGATEAVSTACPQL